MVLNNVSLSQFIVGKLRINLTDYNSNRGSQFGNWIYPDSPMIVKLLNNASNFPRISVESISHSTSGEMGMQDTSHEETETLKITVWSVKNLICTVESTIAESHTFITNTQIYPLTNLPFSTISLVTGTLATVPDHTFVSGTDYQVKDNGGDGFLDSIEWLTTGNEPDNGTDFDVSYNRKASSTELARLIGQNVNEYLRDNWRGWSEHNVWSYRMISANPIPFDEEIGIYRYELQVQFTGINIGEYV